MNGKKIIENFDISYNQDISLLDFGCGPGFMFEHMKVLGTNWLYTGVDSSEDSIKSLTDRFSAEPNFIGAYGSLDELPREAYDVILLIEVVEHLSQEAIEAIFRELKPLLKLDGQIIITTPNNEDLSKSTRFLPKLRSYLS